VCITVIGSLTACVKANQLDTTVPENVEELMNTEPGKSLSEYGYTPVVTLFKEQAVVGAVYIDCGATSADLTTCGDDLHNRGTSARPNIYVVEGEIIALEGPHIGKTDARSYYMWVPDDYREFEALNEVKQRKLLGVMPTIVEVIGKPSSLNGAPKEKQVMTSIGQLKAWVSHETPNVVP
jgi:hypothetical protein